MCLCWVGTFCFEYSPIYYYFNNLHFGKEMIMQGPVKNIHFSVVQKVSSFSPCFLAFVLTQINYYELGSELTFFPSRHPISIAQSAEETFQFSFNWATPLIIHDSIYSWTGPLPWLIVDLYADNHTITLASVVRAEVRQSARTLFFTFLTVLMHVAPLYFSINLINSLSISMRKWWNFSWDCMESICHSGEK